MGDDRLQRLEDQLGRLVEVTSRHAEQINAINEQIGRLLRAQEQFVDRLAAGLESVSRSQHEAEKGLIERVSSLEGRVRLIERVGGPVVGLLLGILTYVLSRLGH